MDEALKGMEEFEADAQKEQKLKIEGAKRFKAGIIRDLERYLSIAENLEIENLDVYRKILKNVEDIQIQEQMPEELERKLNIAREIANQLCDSLYGRQNYKEKQEEANQLKKSKTSDKIIKETGRNTAIVKENKHKNTQKTSIIENTENQGQRDKDYYDPMHEERRKAMEKWSKSQENQGTQVKGTLKMKDEIKTELENEDEEYRKLYEKQRIFMLGL